MAAKASFFNRQINEIRQDPPLVFYGTMLALTHLITYFFWAGWTVPFFWSGQGALLSTYKAEGQSLCLPNFTICGWLFKVPLSWVSVMLGFYCLLSLACVISFLSSRRLSWAFYILLLLTAAKQIFIFSNTFFINNYHYIILVVSLAYLFFPGKKNLIQIFLVLFYVAAGFLKLNTEWLSGQGSTLPQTSQLSLPIIQFLMFAILIFDTVLIFGLLARRQSVRWTAFALMTLLNISVGRFIGFYYSQIISCLTAIFPIYWLSYEGEAQARIFSWRLPRSSVVFILIFVFAQISPHLYRGDSALTGQGRFFALNMNDANAICFSQFVLHFKNGQTKEIDVDANQFPMRTRCQPLRYFNFINNICHNETANPGLLDADVFLIAKRTTDKNYRRTMHIEKFCSQHVTYQLFANNTWIEN